MSVYLKVKGFTLAQEIRFIRNQEKRRRAFHRAIENGIKGFVKTKLEHVSFIDGLTIYGFEWAKLDTVTPPTSDEIGASKDAWAEFWKLREHRAGLKRQARITHIAYTFLRTMGAVPFVAAERKSWTAPPWAEIEKEIDRFAAMYNHLDMRILKQRFAEWKDAAGEWSQPEKKGPSPVIVASG